ncbi:SDR family NAD(P)-dependent oxidoreductase [uncultured Nocardioides sp.]|uniref:SDR family NAD(P)-dependent oxidoreductase n=1 Tax=uncultured Nocardioides sp. TaxID=198441 RepID=UPI002638E0FA|nr:SDR family NAD(P)-dependent oxidoreductase [uncultured Nocardioides sp.]
MARVLVTGSTTGIGHATAASLLRDGHEVVVHARSDARRAGADDLLAAGAEIVVGDLAELTQVLALADAVDDLGPVDAVIHNAGVIDGPVLAVNVVAPYVLTARVPAPRHVVLSSSMHRGGRPDLPTDWSGARPTRSYSDSKLLVTTLVAGVARRRPDLLVHAVDPGWVATRMGGPSASGDLALSHFTQAWLATTDDAEALTSGGYWFHQRTRRTHPAVNDEALQDALLASLAEHTGVDLPGR